MVEVKTIVNEKRMKKLFTYHARNKMWLAFVVSFALIAIGFIILFSPEGDIISCIVIVSIGLFMPMLYWLIVNLMMNRAIKNLPYKDYKLTQIFLFEEVIRIKSIKELGEEVKTKDLEYGWTQLYKAVETPTAFYLHVDKINTFMIDGSDFTQGTPKDLHDLLLEKLGPKKFKYNKRRYK